MSKVSKEIADQDIQTWLTRNHISDDRVEAYETHLKIMIQHIIDGKLVLKEDGQLSLTLETPIGSQSKQITELIFNARVNRKMVMTHLNGVKADNNDGRIVAYMAASTGVNKNILVELMPEDQRVADSITVFFVN